MKAGEEVGGELGTPLLGPMKDSGRRVFMQSLPPPGSLLSPSICGLVLSGLRKVKRFSPSRLNFSVISGGSEVSMEVRGE